MRLALVSKGARTIGVVFNVHSDRAGFINFQDWRCSQRIHAAIAASRHPTCRDQASLQLERKTIPRAQVSNRCDMPGTSIAASPNPIVVDFDRTALIIIDMQRDFLEPGGFG